MASQTVASIPSDSESEFSNFTSTKVEDSIFSIFKVFFLPIFFLTLLLFAICTWDITFHNAIHHQLTSALLFHINLHGTTFPIFKQEEHSLRNNPTKIPTTDIILNETRVVVTMSIRKKQNCMSRFDRIDAYAKSVGADFAMIKSNDHEALQARDPDANVRFNKFYVLHYYLQRYDAVIWFDDTILLNPECPCTPNFFEISPTHIVAARDTRKVPMKVLCQHLREENRLPSDKYCTSQIMFNSGLMVFRRKIHMIIFEEFMTRWAPGGLTCYKNMCDQSMFNLLSQGLELPWFDLNTIMRIDQGSELRADVLDSRPISCVGHATRGTGRYRQMYLCRDWRFCINETWSKAPLSKEQLSKVRGNT